MPRRDPKTPEVTPLQALARKCAMAGLKLDDAVALFTSLYIADALAMCQGNVTRAAEHAQISRVTLARNNRRAREKGAEE